MTTGPAPSPAPRAGSLEWLADQQPDAIAVVDARTGRTLTRAAHETSAAALADGLAVEHAITGGSRVGLRLPAGPELLVAQYALAKLGAAPLVLDARRPADEARRLAAAAGAVLLVTDALPGVASPGAVPELPASGLGPLIGRHVGGERRLSGEQPPADGIQATDGDAGPPVLLLRRRTPERVARLGAAVGDLLGRAGLPTGGVHLLGAAASAGEPQFWASVALLTAGTVVTQPDPDPAAVLETLGAHEVTSAVFTPAELRALTALPADVTDEADLTTLQRVLITGPVDAALADAAADLLGEDVAHVLLTTAQTGPFALAPAGEAVADGVRPLAGVTVTATPGGDLLVASPLAADGVLGDGPARGGWPAPPAWTDGPVPTGLTGAVTAAGRVRPGG